MFLRNPKVGVIVEHFGNKKDYKYKLTKDKPILVPAGTEVVPVYLLVIILRYSTTRKMSYYSQQVIFGLLQKQ